MSLSKEKDSNPQMRGENFRGDDGRVFMVRCYKCDGERGRENYAMAVASGICAWCGDDANLYDQLEDIVEGKE